MVGRHLIARSRPAIFVAEPERKSLNPRTAGRIQARHRRRVAVPPRTTDGESSVSALNRAAGVRHSDAGTPGSQLQAERHSSHPKRSKGLTRSFLDDNDLHWITAMPLQQKTKRQKQRIAALAAGNEKRVEKARIKRGLADGSLTLADVFGDRPPVLAGWPLWRVVGLAGMIGDQKLARLNRAAIVDGVNLAVTLERAAEGTLRFVLQWLEQPEPTQYDPGLHDPDSWRDCAESLEAAVRQHAEDIHGADPAGFGRADRSLYAACEQIMAAMRRADGEGSA